MTSAALITFVLIAGFVWGGFATILTIAIRKEGRKTDVG
ncbi:MAG: MetS family NSS transporter small subunit [Longimicrobiales bacterium]